MWGDQKASASPPGSRRYQRRTAKNGGELSPPHGLILRPRAHTTTLLIGRVVHHSKLRQRNVRFGSQADIGARLDHVRYSPESGHSQLQSLGSRLLPPVLIKAPLAVQERLARMNADICPQLVCSEPNGVRHSGRPLPPLKRIRRW